MPEFNLQCGYGLVECRVPTEDVLGVLIPPATPAIADMYATTRAALNNPIQSAPLREIVKPGETVCIIVNDITRAWTRSDLFLPAILDELNDIGVPNGDIFIVMANGTHRPHTKEEDIFLCGREAYDRVRVYNHDSHDPAGLTLVGRLSDGHPVFMNKRMVEADKVIATGGILHHFLAGFGGGLKAVMPGCTDYATIQKNHSLALHPTAGKGPDPRVASGHVDGNPLFENIVEIVRLSWPDFLFDIVINEKGEIARIACGEPLAAYREGARQVGEIFNIEITELADLVVGTCGGYPKDIDLYQTYKTVDDCHRACRPGGAIVVLAECSDGVGNEDFYNLVRDYKTSEDQEAELRRKYTIAGFMAYTQAAWAQRQHIILVTSMPDHVIEAFGCIPAHSLEEGLAIARTFVGEHPRTYIMPRAADTFPVYVGK